MSSLWKYSLAVSPAVALAAVPIAASEFWLGLYLTFWGFKASPITAGLAP
jgi:hypothetical protein